MLQFIEDMLADTTPRKLAPPPTDADLLDQLRSDVPGADVPAVVLLNRWGYSLPWKRLQPAVDELRRRRYPVPMARKEVDRILARPQAAIPTPAINAEEGESCAA